MINLGGVDLNLLVAFDALLSERSVTRAAQRLGLSQPAMSNALARLRTLLDDPVLVRTGRRMEPTARAQDLAVPVHQLLQDVRQVLAPPPSFDPTTSTQRFRIESSDDVELSLAPQIALQLAAVAPNADLVLTRASSGTEEELRMGRADLYLGPWFKIPGHLHRHLLHHETFSCVARRGHPHIESRLTLRTYARVGHVGVTRAEHAPHWIDTALVDHGLDRDVVRTASFSVAAQIVACSDLIATFPRSVARALAEFFSLELFRPPIDVSGVPIHVVWHPRTHDLASHRWLRALIMDVAASDEW